MGTSTWNGKCTESKGAEGHLKPPSLSLPMHGQGKPQTLT